MRRPRWTAPGHSRRLPCAPVGGEGRAERANRRNREPRQRLFVQSDRTLKACFPWEGSTVTQLPAARSRPSTEQVGLQGEEREAARWQQCGAGAWGSETRIRSRGGAVVLMDESAEQVPAVNVARIDRDRDRGFSQRRGQGEGAMGSLLPPPDTVNVKAASARPGTASTPDCPLFNPASNAAGVMPGAELKVTTA